MPYKSHRTGPEPARIEVRCELVEVVLQPRRTGQKRRDDNHQHDAAQVKSPDRSSNYSFVGCRTGCVCCPKGQISYHSRKTQCCMAFMFCCGYSLLSRGHTVSTVHAIPDVPTKTGNSISALLDLILNATSDSQMLHTLQSV